MFRFKIPSGFVTPDLLAKIFTTFGETVAGELAERDERIEAQQAELNRLRADLRALREDVEAERRLRLGMGRR